MRKADRLRSASVIRR